MVSRRFLGLLAVLLIVAGLGLPLAATTTTAPTATTGAGGTATTAGVIVPAVSVEVTVPIETQPDWTYRFFIPALLVMRLWW